MDIDKAVITTATHSRPTRVLIHGIEGWGKTWLASHFPSPVWLAPENGFPRDLPFTPARVKVTTWDAMFGAVKMLKDQPHTFESVIIDTVDWVEPLIHAFVLQRDSGRETEMNKKGKKLESIEDYGYGKGYIAAEEEWRRFLAEIDELQARRGMHVILLAHSGVKTFRNPAGEDFDRWQPKMHDRISRVCVEWPETVLFGHYDLSSGKLDSDDKKAKGFSEGKRLVGLRYSAMYDAKNRLGLPPVVELTDAALFVPYLLGTHLPEYTKPTTIATPTQSSAPAQTQPAQRSEPLRADLGTQSAPKDWAPASTQPTQQPVEQKQQPAPVQQTESERRHDAQNWTEPKPFSAPASQRGAPAQTQPAATSTPAQTQPAQSKNAQTGVDSQLLGELTNALSLAKKKGDAYAANVEGWSKQANGDPKKLRAIIDRVAKDCAPTQAAG